MNTTPDIVTFGCRLNTYESEVMRAHAMAAGLHDCVIVNTCAVTAEAVRQARQTIRKNRRARPDATIIVTGCAAQVDPYNFAAMPEVDYVVGNDLKMQAETYVNLGSDKIHISDMQKVRETAAYMVQGFEGKSRAFVQVQNGCDNRCTFCIIPYGRGPSRSVGPDDVIAQMEQLWDQGYREMALTGVDIASYGRDLGQGTMLGGPTLGGLVRQIMDRMPAGLRLRLSSMDPAAIDDDLWDLIGAEERLMPHLHLSLQAGDDMVLKRMKRRHRAQDVRDLCARARSIRPDIVFGADVIAGFPTEDDAMFARGYDLIESCDITWLHVFPYSARKGTPAARMPQMPVDIRRARAARLRALGDAAIARHLAGLVGKQFDVLVEKPDLGRAGGFAEVRLTQGDATIGAVVRVLCTGVQGKYAVADIIKDEDPKGNGA